LFWSFCCLALRCLLQLVVLRPRSKWFKELEIIVLGHELSVYAVRWVDEFLHPTRLTGNVS
jgi:hypothetical protein